MVGGRGGGRGGLLTLSGAHSWGDLQEHLSSNNTRRGPCTRGAVLGAGHSCDQSVCPREPPASGETAVPTTNQAVSCQVPGRKLKAEYEESAVREGSGLWREDEATCPRK